MSESFRDIKGIVLSAGSVRLQTTAWHIWPRFRFSASVSCLAATRLRYSLVVTQQNATFCGLRTPAGAVTPKFELGRDFCTMHLSPKFIILWICLFVRKLSCWQIKLQTNKQIPAKTSNVLRYATALGNNKWRHCYLRLSTIVGLPNQYVVNSLPATVEAERVEAISYLSYEVVSPRLSSSSVRKRCKRISDMM